jgi:hypothetical protein
VKTRDVQALFEDQLCRVLYVGDAVSGRKVTDFRLIEEGEEESR